MTRVSFVVIAYNEERCIARAIDAILALDGLSPRDEVVVVDDGSSDATPALVADAAAADGRVRLVALDRNAGRGAARAAGIAAARGSQVAFVDADIVLPPSWLVRCRAALAGAGDVSAAGPGGSGSLDAVGGVAVPDGDVSYVHRRCGLVPKVVPHTEGLTGSNALFRREVFDRVVVDPERRNGEDIALARDLREAGFGVAVVPGLIVDHLETKSWSESLAWLVESGIGAGRQLAETGVWRLPDVAFAAYGVVAALAVVLAVGVPHGWQPGLVMVVGYPVATGAAHLHRKFSLGATPLRSLSAVPVAAALQAAYYLGRCAGLRAGARAAAEDRPAAGGGHPTSGAGTAATTVTTAPAAAGRRGRGGER